MDLSVFANATFFFLDLSKDKLCSILVFGNVRFNILVRINHDNVASRGLLDVLTPLSDCRQESVEKMERRISEVSYMCWMDFHNGILCCGFLCARLISFSFVSIASFVSFPATTPRATTPHLYLTGHHAQGYHAFATTARLSRLFRSLPFTGYHATCFFLHLHHHRGATRTNLLHTGY